MLVKILEIIALILGIMLVGGGIIYLISKGRIFNWFLPSRVEINTILNELPSVTSQPKMGHWYRSSCDICYTCSFCGVTNASGTKYNYCPHCGARMEGVE